MHYSVMFSLALACIFSVSARAAIVVNVDIVDPAGTFVAFHDSIRTHAVASGTSWGMHLLGSASLDLQVVFDNSIPRATGGSVTSSFVARRAGFNIFEQGVAAEIRTGVDPNGSAPDLRFTFNSNYLQNELWFDPDPFARVTSVPSNRTDAMSVFLHEFGHAIAFNGWQDSFDGSFPGDFKSTFDELKSFDGSDFFFNGTAATSLYGSDVPVTFGNATHLGNDSPRPGSDLIPDLMNGVVFLRGTRYDISPLDLAILSDTGLTVVAIPEPGSFGFALIVMVPFLYSRWRSKTGSS